MTIIEDRLLAIDDLHLAAGKHDDFAHGACLLEAAAWLAGEPFSDYPDCVDPVLAAFGRSWNDVLPDEDRDRILKPFLPRLIGTRSTAEVQDRRAFMAADWTVRTYTPAWLRLANLDAEADALGALSELSTVELCQAAMPVIAIAKEKAIAAWAAAGAAARDAGAAARDAGAAARDAGAAVWAAVWAAARAAARDAARAAAARDAAARDAARDAAWAAAWAAAARAAAGDAAGDAAWAAAWAAARDALRPTVIDLQTSAADLFDRMIAITEKEPAA